MRIVIACVVTLLVAASALGKGDLLRRQVAAPPEDVSSGRVRLPDPAEAAVSSSTAWVAVVLDREADGSWAWEGEFPVGASGPLALAWIGADALAWRVSFGPDGTAPRPLEQWLRGAGVEYRAGFERELGAQRVELTTARAGTWRVRVEGDRPNEGWLASRDSCRARLTSHLSTFATLAGADVAVLASVHEGDGNSPSLETMERVDLVVELAGESLREPMFDAGLHGDGAAGNGLFGAYLPAGLAGALRARVEARGITSAGESFLRVTHHRVHLVPRDVELLARARTATDATGRTEIAIEVALSRDPRTILVAAEMWGKDASGLDVPVCWLARLAEPESTEARWSLPLALDPGWIALAAAQAPFELREVRLHDPGTNVLLDRVARIDLGEIALAAVVPPAPDLPTWSMLGAPAGSSSLPTGAPVPPRSTTRALLLVHGYCSGGGVWPPADFSPPKRDFLDPNADRTNDEFAQIMLAQTGDLGSFGVVAHSQGGLAALQLYAYYVSGLDYASGPRRIQSVASPYQGTPLAAFAATCGTHNDLTPEEAAVWLSTIPSWARAEVHYRTVSDSSAACNFFTDFLLADPEDGVVERFRGELPGGNAMGHVTGWCHTTGMSDPACYSDHARNQEMDANAAR